VQQPAENIRQTVQVPPAWWNVTPRYPSRRIPASVSRTQAMWAIYLIFKNSGCTSQETRHVTINNATGQYIITGATKLKPQKKLGISKS
jgi:hypothetical protein